MLNTLKHITRHPLNRNGRKAALSRYLRWQFASRLLPVPHVMPFVNDTFLITESGMTGATGNWYSGLHEEVEMAFLLHFLRPGDLFADIGSNIGAYTVLASGAVGANSVSFEPVPETFIKLQRNVTANRIEALATCHNLGLGESNETLLFTADQDTTNHVATAGEIKSGSVLEVDVCRLDDILNGDVPSLIKIDVEGWEAKVLAGMPFTLANPCLKAIITESNQSANRYKFDAGDSVFDLMTQHGFKVYSYDIFGRRLIEGVGSTPNTIFLRDIEFAHDRVSRAGEFRLVTGTI